MLPLFQRKKELKKKKTLAQKKNSYSSSNAFEKMLNPGGWAIEYKATGAAKNRIYLHITAAWACTLHKTFF